MKTLTLQILKDYHGDNFDETQNFAYSFNELSYPNGPKKPVLGNKATSADARLYADLLEVYDAELAMYKEELKKYYAVRNAIDDTLVEFIKDLSGLNTIPAQYRDKVYSYAYSQGHSGGYGEVLNYLIELVEIF